MVVKLPEHPRRLASEKVSAHRTNKKAPGSEQGFKDAPVYGIAPLNVQNYPKRKSTQTAVQKIQVIVQKKMQRSFPF